MALRALCAGPGLIADGLESVDPVLERRVLQIGDARFNSVVEAFEAAAARSAKSPGCCRTHAPG